MESCCPKYAGGEHRQGIASQHEKENTMNRSRRVEFDWRDPLLLEDVLSEEERMVHDLSLIHI